MRGKFIALEGGDGAGKSTTVAWLKRELSDKNIIFTREPGGTESAEEIREVLVKRRDDDLDVFSQILLFEASRREHVVKKIIPALESGTHVITDRFSASTYAYQIVAGEGSRYHDMYLSIDTMVREGASPDLTIMLDVEPELGIERKRDSGAELNTFDDKEIEFYVKVREAVRHYVSDKPHVIIDANCSEEEMHDSVKRAILSCIE